MPDADQSLVSTSNFEFTELAPGDYRLVVYGRSRSERGAIGFVSSPIHQVQVMLEEGEEKEVDIGYGANYAVAGRITIAGEAMAEGVVALQEQPVSESMQRITRTDAEGNFEFPHVEQGAYDLVAVGHA